MRWDSFLYRRTLINFLLYPFSLIFSLILQIRRNTYRYGLIKAYIPETKTISVGNIVAGGSGKTPFTIFLAKLLSQRGYRVAVSHRGYKGKYENTNFLLSDREGLKEDSPNAGDEALLIAKKLPGIPVIVGKNRRKSIQILQRDYPDLDWIILDDSFQHLKVKKTFDFVLFNSQSKLGNGYVIPAGILRESLNSLRFADFLVYNGADEIPLELLQFGKKIIRINYRICSFTSPDGKTFKPEEFVRKRIAILSGIGQPDSFEKTLSTKGIEFQKHYRFPDHHDYKNTKSFSKIVKELKENFDFVLTTEKDFPKLSKYSAVISFVIVSIETFSKDEAEILNLIS